jgi:pterin-4a-carbinolamine dehydratase
LYLSSTAPIHFSADRQTINICLKDGSVITQKFSPTPKANLDRLAKALSELLQAPDQPPVIEPPNKEAGDIPGISFGSVEWYLDAEGDAIHRHIALPSAGELDTIEELILRRADEMDHHPHISRGKVEGGADTYMTITCTTHSPRGLSVRDSRLALKITEILADFNTVTPSTLDTRRDLEGEQLRIAALRERMVAANRVKINKALENCGCETAKSKSTTPPQAFSKEPV